MATKKEGRLGVDWVWRLTANDMCKNKYCDGEKCCLLVWVSKIFGYSGNPRYAFLDALFREIRHSRYDICDVMAYNDAPGRRLSTLANTFNKAAIAEGFTEEYED